MAGALCIPHRERGHRWRGGFRLHNLATLSSTAGKAGDPVTGSDFRVNPANLAVSDAVVLRWNSTEGTELAPVQPDKAGNISATFAALGLALFGAGFVAFVRQARRRDVPVTASVRK